MYFILNLGVEGLKYSSIEILKLFHVSPTETARTVFYCAPLGGITTLEYDHPTLDMWQA